MPKTETASIPHAATGLGRGKAAAPDPEGRCGECGFAHFAYNNGHEFSADGVRGYRCVNCGSIKPEDWRSKPHNN